MRFILICMKDESVQPSGIATAPVAAEISSRSPRRLSSAALLQGERQIVIEHAGREYCLRLTAQGKLILTA
jgi:hemin uptake protein HemP